MFGLAERPGIENSISPLFGPGGDIHPNNSTARDNRAYRYPVGMTTTVALC